MTAQTWTMCVGQNPSLIGAGYVLTDTPSNFASHLFASFEPRYVPTHRRPRLRSPSGRIDRALWPRRHSQSAGATALARPTHALRDHREPAARAATVVPRRADDRPRHHREGRDPRLHS